MKKRIIIFITLVLFATVLYSESTWSYLGLGGKTVVKLEIYDSEIFAVTNGGIYKKPISSIDTLWTLVSEQEESFWTFIKKDDLLIAGRPTS